MLLLSVSMSWICFRKAVLNPVCVGKSTYSNKEKFGILEENLKPPYFIRKPNLTDSRKLRSPLTNQEVSKKSQQFENHFSGSGSIINRLLH